MHGKITRYLGKITRYLRLESASRVTAESAVAPAVTALSRPSLHSLSRDRSQVEGVGVPG